MSKTWCLERFAPEPIRAMLERECTELEIFWLGQAGFVLRAPGTSGSTLTVLIDAYLSNHLQKKYAGTTFEHVRLMEPPVSPLELPRLDAVFCTHHHSDHMDPDALLAISTANPDAPLVVPAASSEHCTTLGIPTERLLGVDISEARELASGLRIWVLPAAHEELSFDTKGRCRFLGYVIEMGGVRVYHSGDCVPYEGQVERLVALSVDMALLPVNGRDAYRLENGVPGNFHPGEAHQLCHDAAIPFMIAHHHGMFAFNTLDPLAYGRAVTNGSADVSMLLAAPGIVYRGKD